MLQQKKAKIEADSDNVFLSYVTSSDFFVKTINNNREAIALLSGNDSAGAAIIWESILN